MSEQKTVLALGFFDGIHTVHAALRDQAKAVAAKKGARAAVLTFDNHPDNFVKKEPVELINSAHDRQYILRRFYGIEDVFFIHFNAATMRMPWEEFIENVLAAYDPIHFVVGHDFSFGYKGEGTAEKLKAYARSKGLGCDIIPAVTKDGVIVSSTYIRELLQNGEVEKANTFLGHPYLMTDTVRSGFRLGRKMDYPTVNMRFSEGVLVPKKGVYVARITLADGVHTAVTNIGTRPTFDGDRVTVESHILSCDADLYGKELCVEFYEYIRPERKFSTAEQLSAQIKLDAQRAKEYFE